MEELKESLDCFWCCDHIMSSNYQKLAPFQHILPSSKLFSLCILAVYGLLLVQPSGDELNQFILMKLS